jgi:antirestriction protein ArdC
VRKGEHGQQVVFWRIEEKSERDYEANSECREETEKERRRFVLRLYRVFNVEQCELPQAVLDKLPTIETHQHDPIEAAERIMANMPNPPAIEYSGSKAFYSPTADRITMPPRELFSSAEEFYATLNHESAHAVGSPKRLNRKSIADAAPFGSPAYSLEELIAELSAAYLCAESGISPAVITNQAAYVQGWLAKLKGDKRFVVIAAAKAQQAADYILGRMTNS